jgi:Tol biopolymer transport system component
MDKRIGGLMVLVVAGATIGAAWHDADPHGNYNPAWSPDGSRILIDSNRDGDWEIYSVRPDGSDEIRLTQDAGSDMHSDWAPGSDQIVFMSDRDGDRDIYIMRSDGSDLRQVVNEDGHDDSPAWSPQGHEIVFSSDRDGDTEIFVLDLRDGQTRQLTHNDVGDDMPVWSPNGEKVLFSSDDKLQVISREGGTSTEFQVESELPLWKTSWSRDGMSIAMTEVDAANRNLDILVLDFRSGELRRMTPFPGIDRHPSWSPNGEHLAFTSVRDGQPDVFVIPVEGGDPVRITEGSGPR